MIKIKILKITIHRYKLLENQNAYGQVEYLSVDKQLISRFCLQAISMNILNTREITVALSMFQLRVFVVPFSKATKFC